ncbi:MAG: hypothetical protein K2G06_04045, partial [Muribaculaceae bacterium]|nr:hypothetical protein [Muribaculaceae bacterium]
ITQDKKSMIVDSFVLWRVTDPKVFAQTLNTSEQNAEGRINVAVYNSIKNVISSLTQSDIIAARGLKLTKLIMENPRAYGFALNPEQFYTPMEYDIVEVSTPVADWPTWAKKHGITYAQLKDANLWIRDKTLPNKTGKTYRVRVPKQSSLHRSTASKNIYNPAWVK